MKNIIFIASFCLLFASCNNNAYLGFEVSNRSSEPLLVSFYDGEEMVLNLKEVSANTGLVSLKELEFDDYDELLTSFHMLWKNSTSEFRVYSKDTVLLRVWTPSYSLMSEQKEFYRESDWDKEESGMFELYLETWFSINDSDLPNRDSVNLK